MEIMNLDESYLEEALELAEAEYKEELKKCPSLPTVDVKQYLKGMVGALFEAGNGKLALEDGRLAGYMAFFGPFDGMHGQVKGVFSPLGGSAFGGVKREKTASRLFAAIADELSQKQVFLYALSRFAHDDEVGRSLIMNAFGIRCSDSVLRLADRHIVDEVDESLVYEELTGKEKSVLLPLRIKLENHLRKGPCFFPTPEGAAEKWLEEEDVRVITVKKDGNLIGYLALEEEEETFVSAYPKMDNICGAFVDEKYRGTGIAAQLLEYLCSKIEGEGREYLGVDCETMNPTALHFWGKYFQNYTYSYERRIDERVVPNKN